MFRDNCVEYILIGDSLVQTGARMALDGLFQYAIPLHHPKSPQMHQHDTRIELHFSSIYIGFFAGKYLADIVVDIVVFMLL